jgi:hypothetical protein
VLACVLVFSARPAFAQGSSIAGTVTDTTGAVMPGVTVEAASPSLIEGTRSAVSDGGGRYAIVELRPGTYTVTFTLPGFSTVRREGIELAPAFSANVSVQLRVGSLEETITVSGSAPVVDVQSTLQQRLVPKDVIDAIPTGKSWSQLGVLMVGVTSIVDIGGSTGEQQNPLAAHGGATGDKIIEMDGMRLGLLLGTTSSTGISSNDASTQDISIDIGAISAETGGGGVRVNVIPKEGGNRYSGSLFGQFANKSMSSSNYSDKLKADGVRAPDRVKKIYDYSGALGGPLMRDKLWFFTAQRWWGYQNLQSNAFYEENPIDYLYDPSTDSEKQAYDDQTLASHNLRLTWQMTQKNKLGVFYDFQPRCTCHWQTSATRAVEAAVEQHLAPNWYGTASFTSTLSNKLLFTAGFSNLSGTWTVKPIADERIPIDPATGRLTTEGYGVNDSGLGILYRATGAPFQYNFSATRNYKASLNFVTGSHQMKFGMTMLEGERIVRNWMTNGDIRLNFSNRRPLSITKYVTPFTKRENLEADLGLYAQDTWAIKRLTLNLALRFDYMNQSVPVQDTPGGTWLGARHFDAVKDVPNWKDFGPRLGVAYDLFGTGKTAIKASVSRYVQQTATDFASANNPISTTRSSVTQAWSDANGDFLPQPNELSGPDLPGPLGSKLPQTVYDDAVREGWGVRRNNWEFSTGFQQELLPRIGTDVTYFRRVQGNFTATDNRAVAPADYDHFCVTVANDPRLPSDVSGSTICGLYNIQQVKAGLQDNFVTFNDASRAQQEVWQGVDVSVNARISRNTFMQGGFSTGSSHSKDCGITDSPNIRFCETESPYRTQFKFLGAHTFWWGIQASAAIQSFPGNSLSATWAATSADVRPSLGRNLAGSTTTSVSLIEPFTMFYDRRTQVDLRFTKLVTLPRSQRLRIMVDLYNALNDATITARNTTYGQNWLRPSTVVPGRFVKLGAQLDF